MRYPLDKFFVSQGYSAKHGGIDLAAPCGTKIKSPVSGTVIGDGEDAGYIGGKYVIVRSSKSPHYEVYMGHMASNNVRKGQKVKEGQVIGVVGKTGYATGCHVHFQIRKYGAGALVNPNNFKYKTSIAQKIKKVIKKINPKKYYYVRKGDTVGEIAKRYKISLAKFKKLNPKIKNINLIYPKQKVRVR